MDSHFCLSLWLLTQCVWVGMHFDMSLWVRNRSMLGSMPWSSPWLAEILGVNPMMGPLSEICKRSFCISCLFPVDMIQVWDPQSFRNDASLAPKMHWLVGILLIISLPSSGGKWTDPQTCWREVGRFWKASSRVLGMGDTMSHSLWCMNFPMTWSPEVVKWVSTGENVVVLNDCSHR